MKAIPLICVVLLVACGGDGDDDGGPPPGSNVDPGAPARCETFITALCSRLVDCDFESGFSAGGNRSDLILQCSSALRSNLNCSQAAGTSASYPTCLQDIARSTCSAIWPSRSLVLPGSCRGAILFRS